MSVIAFRKVDNRYIGGVEMNLKAHMTKDKAMTREVGKYTHNIPVILWFILNENGELTEQGERWLRPSSGTSNSVIYESGNPKNISHK